MNKRLLLSVLLLWLVAGCAANYPPGGMYWGNYEQTLYTLENDPSDRARDRHVASLRRIVEVSDHRGWAPPPGVLLELAAYERQMGNTELYAFYVNRERMTYPESTYFIQRWFADVMPPVVVPDTPSDDSQDESDEVMP